MQVHWKQWMTGACLALAAATATAQTSNSIVVGGKEWMASSGAERRAFLIGAANMIAAEAAYAKRNGREPPPAGARIMRATNDIKLAEIEARITQWYESNPGQLAMPVMGVIWQDLAKRAQ